MNSLALRAAALLLLGIALPLSSGSGATHVVPDHYAAIQLAIDATQDGDSVLVRSGTYIENLDLSGKAISLVSESGPAVTIIDGSQPSDPCRSVTVLMSAKDGARLQGFTVTGGGGWGGGGCVDPDDPRSGGGIYVRYGDATGMGAVIEGNWITDNSLDVPGDGGGIYIQGAAHLVRNRIFGNSANDGLAGGGVCARPAGLQAAVLEENEIFDNRIQYVDPLNSGFGGGVEMYGRVDMYRNLIACNWAEAAGGLLTTGSLSGHNVVEGNTIVANMTFPGSSEVAGVMIGSQTDLSFLRNAVAFNFGYGVWSNSVPFAFSCNNIFGNTVDFRPGDPCGGMIGVNGNISADPLFGSVGCEPDPTIYCLEPGSPQLPESSPPDCDLIGARGECLPIGVPEIEPVAPGRLRLQPARPNPFTERTTIPFHLPQAAEVRVWIYDVLGRRQRSLPAGRLPAGDHLLEWDGRNDAAQPVASGAYVARIRVENRELTRTLLLVR